MLQKIKSYFKEVFNFSHSESNGLLCLILIILLSIVAPQICKWYYRVSGSVPDLHADSALLDKHLTLLKAHANQVKLININTTTAEKLAKSGGFQLKLAIRIIHYRDKLGGFIMQDQYKEVYGMTNRVEGWLRTQTIIEKDYTPKKIALNHATFQELVAHPYITPLLAKSIINYRTKQGVFTNLQALKALPSYHPNCAQKILPYLTI